MEIYKPNIGWLFWAHLILILVVIIPILTILTFLGISPAGALIPILLVLLLIVIISLLVVAKTTYTLDDESMTIQGAFKKRDISYGSVMKIIDTNKGAVGEGMFVLSSDRIGIFFGENEKVSISPRNKPDVLSALRAYCPGAEYEEDIKVKSAKADAAESEDAAAEEINETENE